MKKILITGVDGFLGKKIFHVLSKKYDVIGTSRRGSQERIIELDITDNDSIRRIIESVKPTILIHTAALVDVEKSESDKESAYSVNALAPKLFAGLCAEKKIKMIYFSTDYVFDGTAEVYHTNSVRNPVNYYGVTKRNAEDFIIDKLLDYVIIRPSILYGFNDFHDKKNFVLNIIERLKRGEKVILDSERIKYPLLIDDVSEKMIEIIETNQRGIFHFAGPTPITKYDWGKEIADVFGLNSDMIVPAENAEENRAKHIRFDSDAASGMRSVLEGLKLIKLQMGN